MLDNDDYFILMFSLNDGISRSPYRRLIVNQPFKHKHSRLRVNKSNFIDISFPMSLFAYIWY